MINLLIWQLQFTRSGHTQLPSNAIMITSTITVVLFSTMVSSLSQTTTTPVQYILRSDKIISLVFPQVFGLLTKPLIRLLVPARQLNRESSALSDPPSPKSFLDPLILNGSDADLEIGVGIRRPTSLRLLLASPTRSVHHYWRKFDNAFMRPVFGGRGFVPFVPGSPTERSVPLLQGTEN